MRQIEIADADYTRLQAIAVPFVDTPGNVVTKLLDAYGGPVAGKAGGHAEKHNALIFGPESIPPLTHTKVMSASFDQTLSEKANWDSLVRLALLKTKAKYRNVDEIRRISGANIVPGHKSDEGYKPMAGHAFSFQGLSAEDSAAVVVRCARALRCPLDIEFVWRDKEGAYRPGERGIIRYSPSLS